jgi:hypothetical protein
MERTTTTSSLPSAIPEARFVDGFLDELQKISSAIHQERRDKAKKFLKNTALIAGGAGVGSALTTVADKLVGSKLGPAWSRLDPKTKKLIVGPLLGAGVMASRLALRKMYEEKSK